MASWDELKAFVHREWNATELDENNLQLVFELPSLRSQAVVVEHASNEEADWVKFKSAIGQLSEIDLWTAAEALGRKVVGGIIVEEGYVVVVSAMPLANVDRTDIVETMFRVTSIADELENQFLGTDSV